MIIRHNNIRDFEANLVKKVSGDNAKPDIRARGVWRNGQNAYFDVRITNTNSPSQKHLSFEKILEKHEKEKKRQYNDRVMNIEHGTFTPLVFSVNGVMSKECSMFHRYLAQKFANKTNERYEKIIAIIKCMLSFMILRSSLMCIRGSRSYKTIINIDDFEIVFNEARFT